MILHKEHAPKARLRTMKFTRTILRIFGILLPALVIPPAQAATLTALVSFAGTNGASPGSALVLGNDGSFYGTTSVGGSNNVGTVFQMTPSGALNTLVSFDLANGANPSAPVVLGTDGNFYGTTAAGGTNSRGTIFKLTTNGVLTTLVSFDGADNGAQPGAGLIQARDGNFYGTTRLGGTNDEGTAFQMLADGTLTSLDSFDGDGYEPYGGLVQAADGNLYGTAFLGGTNGYGAVFRIATNGALTTLYSFAGTNDGGNPYAGLTQGNDGKLYGTTYFDGASGYGTVFKITTNGVLTTLASFGGTNGANPQAALVQGSDGNYYGTTQSGGAFTNQAPAGYGTIFMITSAGALTTLACFDGTNGAYPLAGLVQGPDGSFYGTASNGGTNGFGTIFRLTIPAAPVFLSVNKAGTTLMLTWKAMAGQTYQIVYETNLNQINWSNLGSTVLATNAAMTTLDTIGPDPQRLYRVVLLP